MPFRQFITNIIEIYGKIINFISKYIYFKTYTFQGRIRKYLSIHTNLFKKKNLSYSLRDICIHFPIPIQKYRHKELNKNKNYKLIFNYRKWCAKERTVKICNTYYRKTYLNTSYKWLLLDSENNRPAQIT